MGTVTIDRAIKIFEGAKRPFVGTLIANTREMTACPYCAQGLVLHESGCSDTELRNMQQLDADARVAKILGISCAESVLLRRVNDTGPGLPQAVLVLNDAGIGRVIGAEWRKLVSFWRHMDTLDAVGWGKIDIAWSAAGYAARDAAGYAARDATYEIMGASKLTKFVFLPMFGFADPSAIPLTVK